MMSINEIKNYSFQPQRGGTYKASEVDEVFSQVKETLDALASAYEKAKKDNDELYRKVGELSDRIEKYRNDEESIHATLITAQRMHDRMIKEAQDKADELVGGAEAKAEETINAIKAETDSYVAENRSSADAYLENAKSVYAEKLAEAEAAAAEYIAKANLTAADIIKDAEIKSDEIIAKANFQSDEITSNADAKIEVAKKKLADLMKLTADYKASAMDIMTKQLALFDTISVDEQDYAAEYYPQTFHIDSSDVYRPEAAVNEAAEEEEADAPAEEAPVSVIDESDFEEIIDDEPEENEEEAVSFVEDIVVEEAPEAETTEEAEPEVIVDEDITWEEEIITEEEDFAEEEDAAEEEAEAEETEKAESFDDGSESDYFETLMKQIAEDTKDMPAEPIEARNTNSVFTAMDLVDGLDDDEETDNIDLRENEEEEEDEIKFGTKYSIFDDDDDEDGQTSFFNRFKKK